MTLKSSKFMPALQRGVQKRATPGERVMGKLFPNSSYVANWSQNRYEQVQHMVDWQFIAIRCIWDKIASIVPNLAYVTDANHHRPGVTTKACHRGLMNLHGAGFGGSPTISHGGHSFLTIGEWKSKALSVVKPHEELEPLESNHPLRELVECPNAEDTLFDYTSEFGMFLELCGVTYEWVIPSQTGRPCEQWILPAHWVWPRTGGGQHVDAEHPDADRLIQYYEVRPWGGTGSAGMLKLPPDQVITTKYKSPINKLDGYSHLFALGRWMDTEESITKSRWAQFINKARPELWIELGPGFEDPSDDMIARWEAKIAAKHQGEFNTGRPLMTPAGAKATVLSFSPEEMGYIQSEDQMAGNILAGWRVPKSAVGLVNDMTFGSILATLMQLCEGALNPKLAMLGQRRTKSLASRWDEKLPAWSTTSGSGHGGSALERKVKLWYDNCTPADPAQVNSDLATDFQCYAATPNEVRVLRGRKPYKLGGNNPMVQGPGGVMPLPINEEESMDDLGAMVAEYTQQIAADKDVKRLATETSEEDVPKEDGDETGQGGLVSGRGGSGVGSSDSGSSDIEDAAVDGGAVDEPNGKPSKSLKANPYRDNGCPVCGEHATSSCRCMGPHTPEQLAKGHGLRCPNGHQFDRDSGKPSKSLVRKALTPSQEAWLKKIQQNGRYGVGEFGGCPRPTAEALQRAGVIEVKTERMSSGLRDFAYPVGGQTKSHQSIFKRWCSHWTKQYAGHDHSSTQFNLEGAALEHVLALQRQIAPEDLAEKGLEDIPHVTVRYGLEGSDAGYVRELVETFGPVDAELGELDYFPSDEHDVLILRVHSDDLHMMNETLRRLPHVNTHPTYQPHVTVAYLKPGMGEHYCGLEAEKEADAGGREPFDLQFTQLVFSPKEGVPTLIDIASYEAQEAGNLKAVTKAASAQVVAMYKRPSTPSSETRAVVTPIVVALQLADLRDTYTAMGFSGHDNWSAKKLRDMIVHQVMEATSSWNRNKPGGETSNAAGGKKRLGPIKSLLPVSERSKTNGHVDTVPPPPKKTEAELVAEYKKQLEDVL